MVLVLGDSFEALSDMEVRGTLVGNPSQASAPSIPRQLRMRREDPGALAEWLPARAL